MKKLLGLLATLAVLWTCSETGSNEPLLTNRPVAEVQAVTEAIAAETFVGAGDISDCGNDNDEATAKLLDSIPGIVFTAGDNVYSSGTPTQFAQCYDPTWGRHKSRTRPSPGNHDYNTRKGAGYYSYFGSNAGPSGLGYYSFDLGTWHIISLNSEVVGKAKSNQEKWLRTDLIGNTSKCTLAYWHKPRFSSGTHHGSDASFQYLWDILYNAGTDVVLNGHEHNYERFAPQTGTGTPDAVHGIREFVVGTGGVGHHDIPVIGIANSEVRNSTSFGVLKLILQDSSYNWQFISTDGEFTDTGFGNCHDAPGALQR